MAKALHPALKRLKGARVVFHGRFEEGQRGRLAAMVSSQQGTVEKDLGPAVTHLVLPDMAAGSAMQKKATALNKKGASIQVMDVDAFLHAVLPTPEDVKALLHAGKAGAAVFAAAVPPIENDHGAAPDCLNLAGENYDGLDLSGFDFSSAAFEKCSFVGAKLSSTIIPCAIECDFSKATGDSPQLGQIDRSRFVEAKFTSPTITSHLEGSDFTGAVFDRATFSANFWGSAVNARPADSGPRFVRASLRECIFDDVWTKAPCFDEADLEGAAFDGCRMPGGSFRNANLRSALLVNADLSQGDLRGACLAGANLAEADLAGARLDDADLSNCNLRGANFKGTSIDKARGYDPKHAAAGRAGPAIAELDKLLDQAKQVRLAFRIDDGQDKKGTPLEMTIYGGRGRHSAHLWLPTLNEKVSPKPLGVVGFSKELLQAGRVFGHCPVRFETVTVQSTRSPKSGRELRDLMMRAISEAFAQPLPGEGDPAAAKAFREEQRALAAAQREERAREQKEKEQQKKDAAKAIAKQVAKAVGGKVSDIGSFLKALEVRCDKPKIDKATSMLKASGFQLFNDVSDQSLTGVVKSQTDPDLVYACRIDHEGHYACCTQNLNICGGLRGSICKHLLVLIIGLVKAGELDPSTIDAWIARTHQSKPELDKETMGAIFIKYKGAEAGEIDWRPTQTLPEDYYTL